jgi:transcriptional/translational regulatory protein YebC/TACO1
VGGANPEANPRLALAILKAKKGSCHKSSIDAAIARGQGLSSSGAKLETFVEGATLTQTPSAAILIDCLTDNQTQTRIDIRAVLKKFNAITASTTYLFDRIGKITFSPREGVAFDTFAEYAIEEGVLNFEDGDNNWIVETEVSNITSIGNRIVEHLDLKIEELEIIWKPKMDQSIEDSAVQELLRDMIEQLEEISSVRGVYTNILVSEYISFAEAV